MFISHADFDKCLRDGQFHDEIITLPLNGMRPEFLMTRVNKRENNWRLCKARRVPGTDAAKFTRRVYLEEVEIDQDKYSQYFEKEILPSIRRSNALIKDQFPHIQFHDSNI